MKRRLIAAIACRNQGSRLYGKPIQNLDIISGTRVLDNIIECLKSIECIDEIILGISEGVENELYKTISVQHNLRYIIGSESDVLYRLVECGRLGRATDIFRVTSESPFLYYDEVVELWESHVKKGTDACFMDDIIDGCGFEIISQKALELSHLHGDQKHRSELCTLFIRENHTQFDIIKASPPRELERNDLRLTVDNPEDLVVCRVIYNNFKHLAPRIPVSEIVKFLDEHPNLIALVAPFTDNGYASMYNWGGVNDKPG